VNHDSGVPKVWSDVEHFLGAGSVWGSVIVKVSADGTMIERYDRYNWNHTYFDDELNEAVTIVGDAAQFQAWQANMTLEEGEFIVAAHGSAYAPPLRETNLSYGDSVSIIIGYRVEHVISLMASYTLTITD